MVLTARSLICLLVISLSASTAGASLFKVLVFTETQGYRHASIEAGVETVQQLGLENDFEVDVAVDSSSFTTLELGQYSVVVWLNTTGDVLNEEEQVAFESFIEVGGGYVGVHAAADCEYDWPWYGELLGNGAWFHSHPAIQEANLVVAGAPHGSTEHLSATWSFRDEWYNFQASPSAVATVLLDIDESTYDGGTMGTDHPIAWFHEFDGGRVWYTGLGHLGQTFEDVDFRAHLLGGIMWAATAGEDGVACVTHAVCDDGDPCTTDMCIADACINNPYDLDGDGVTTFFGDIGELVGCLMTSSAGNTDDLDDCCSAGNCRCRLDRNTDGFISVVSDLPLWALCVFGDFCR